jgi:hypothetical protein
MNMLESVISQILTDERAAERKIRGVDEIVTDSAQRAREKGQETYRADCPLCGLRWTVALEVNAKRIEQAVCGYCVMRGDDLELALIEERITLLCEMLVPIWRKGNQKPRRTTSSGGAASSTGTKGEEPATAGTSTKTTTT